MEWAGDKTVGGMEWVVCLSDMVAGLEMDEESTIVQHETLAL